MTVVSVGTARFAEAAGAAMVVRIGASAAGEAGENPLQMPVAIMTSAERRMFFLRFKCIPDCVLSQACVRDAAAIDSRAFSAMCARDDGMRLTLRR
jgi:hypothetical protein